MTEELLQKGGLAKAASYKIATVKTDVKNKALEAIADALEEKADEIIEANKKDIQNAIEKGKKCYLLGENYFI